MVWSLQYIKYKWIGFEKKDYNTQFHEGSRKNEERKAALISSVYPRTTYET